MTPARPAAPPKIDPTIRPIPTPVTPKVDATWISPSPEPPTPSFAPDVARTDRIAPERRIETPPHPFEESDFDNRLELALSDVVDHDPGPSLHSEPALEASAGVQTDQIQEDAKAPGWVKGIDGRAPSRPKPSWRAHFQRSSKRPGYSDMIDRHPRSSTALLHRLTSLLSSMELGASERANPLAPSRPRTKDRSTIVAT